MGYAVGQARVHVGRVFGAWSVFKLGVTWLLSSQCLCSAKHGALRLPVHVFSFFKQDTKYWFTLFPKIWKYLQYKRGRGSHTTCSLQVIIRHSLLSGFSERFIFCIQCSLICAAVPSLLCYTVYDSVWVGGDTHTHTYIFQSNFIWIKITTTFQINLALIKMTAGPECQNLDPDLNFWILTLSEFRGIQIQGFGSNWNGYFVLFPIAL